MVLAQAGLQSQGIANPQLRETIHTAGIVADAEGKPVAGAQIDHASDRLRAKQTDMNGRFELATRAPILVVRKPGFRSELIHTQGATEVRVTLRRFSKSRRFPVCELSRHYEAVTRWGTGFHFATNPLVKAGEQGRDIDYGMRRYYLQNKPKRPSIMHGSGSSWSSGVPEDTYVWRSMKYGEIAYDFGGIRILDAWGQVPNGRWWRYLGMLGESASYSDVDEASAKIFDQFIDGACMMPGISRQ